MIFGEFLGIDISERSCILQPRLQQKSPRFAEDSGRNREDSYEEKICTVFVFVKCPFFWDSELQFRSYFFCGQDSDRSRQDSEQFSAHPRAPGV